MTAPLIAGVGLAGIISKRLVILFVKVVSMSLNKAQLEVTARELQQNFAESGLTLDQLSVLTRLPTKRLEKIMTLRGLGLDPVETWMVRDYLESAVKRNGGTFTPFTYLSDANRSAAEGWFGIKDYRDR